MKTKTFLQHELDVARANLKTLKDGLKQAEAEVYSLRVSVAAEQNEFRKQRDNERELRKQERAFLAQQKIDRQNERNARIEQRKALLLEREAKRQEKNRLRIERAQAALLKAQSAALVTGIKKARENRKSSAVTVIKPSQSIVE